MEKRIDRHSQALKAQVTRERDREIPWDKMGDRDLKFIGMCGEWHWKPV